MADIPLGVTVARLNPGDVARGAKELVDYERLCASAWLTRTPDERDAIRTIIRAGLIRLLETDDWIPGSVFERSGRIDVHMTFEVTGDLLRAAAKRPEVLEARRRTRARLVELLAELERADVESA